MTSLPVGLFFLIVASFFSLNGNPSQYLQLHSTVIVGIGSIAVMFLTTPSAILKNTYYSLLGLLQKEESFSNFDEVIRQLVRNKNEPLQSTNPILRYAQQLWEQGVNSDLFIALLSEKRMELESKNVDVIHSLKNLSKYPPALGMIGTVMGMIDLFSALDQNSENIGSALSVAMTSTFMGLLISNILIAPLADRLHLQHMKSNALNTSLYEILLLINAEQPLALIDEEIKNRAA